MKTEGLRVLTTIPAAPTTLYLAWLSSEQHGAMTSGEAKIEPVVGSDFSALSGFITGKLVVLDLGRRIVMSWRTTDFPREAPDSRVEIFFEALGGSTRVTVLHRDIPVGQGEPCKSTWNDKYFGPMRAFFSKFLPDPRDPPPPRRPIPPPDEDDEDEIEEPKAMKGKKVIATKPVVAANAPEKPEKKAEKPAPAPKPAPEPKKAAPPPPASKPKKAEKAPPASKPKAEKAPPPKKTAPPKKAEKAPPPKKKTAPPAKPAKKPAPPPKKAAAPAKKKAAAPSKPAKKKKK